MQSLVPEALTESFQHPGKKNLTLLAVTSTRWFIMGNHDPKAIISLRDAIKKVFLPPTVGRPSVADELPISNVHTWVAKGIFVPYQRARPRDKAGSRLCKSDLVYLSVLRYIFRVGLKFTNLGSWTSFFFRKGNFRPDQKAKFEAAEAQGRGAQEYFEIRNYSVFLHIRPLAIGAHFLIFDELSDIGIEFNRAMKVHLDDTLNLEPHTFINVFAHSEYISRRLRAIGLE